MVDFRCEEVETCQDAPVGAEVVLFHYFFVVYRVADVDVAFEGHGADCGIEVDDVGRGGGGGVPLVVGVQVGVEALHEGRFAGAGHAYADDGDGWVLLLHGGGGGRGCRLRGCR